MVHLNPNGNRSLGSGIAFLVIATLAVALRLYTKTLTKAKWAADDWWICLSLVGFFAWIGIEFWGIFSGGGGKNIQDLLFDFKTLQTYLKSLYVLAPFYFFTITASRLSILSLYRRIFVTKRIQQVILVVGALCVLWWVVSTIITLNPCRPVKKFWQPQMSGYCYNYDQFVLGITIAEIFLDTIILLLPMKPVMQLQISRSRKVLLSAIFLVGGFIIITGIVRLDLLYVPHSRFVNFTRGSLWSNIHLGTAILCACLPTYRPTLSRLVVLAKSFSTRVTSLFSGRGRLQGSESKDGYSMGAYSKRPSHYNPLRDPAADQDRLGQANIAHTSRGESFDKVSDRGGNHITVERTIEVV